MSVVLEANARTTRKRSVYNREIRRATVGACEENRPSDWRQDSNIDRRRRARLDFGRERFPRTALRKTSPSLRLVVLCSYETDDLARLVPRRDHALRCILRDSMGDRAGARRSLFLAVRSCKREGECCRGGGGLGGVTFSPFSTRLL